MGGKASRDKGQRGEREVCKLLSEALNLSVTRELGASRDGGCDIKIKMGDLTYVIQESHSSVSGYMVGSS